MAKTVARKGARRNQYRQLSFRKTFRYNRMPAEKAAPGNDKNDQSVHCRLLQLKRSQGPVMQLVWWYQIRAKGCPLCQAPTRFDVMLIRSILLHPCACVSVQPVSRRLWHERPKHENGMYEGFPEPCPCIGLTLRKCWLSGS